MAPGSWVRLGLAEQVIYRQVDIEAFEASCLATSTRTASHLVFGSKVRELGCAWAWAFRQHAAADNARMETLIRHARQVCTAVVGAAVAMVTMTAAAAPAAPSCWS